MPLGITDEHLALHDAVRGWLERHCPPSVPRATLEAERDERPELWPLLVGQGWLGLHVDEEHGGSGYGFAELCVVLEELGRAMTPGPVLPTVAAAGVIRASTNDAARDALLPGLAAGELVATVAGGPGGRLRGERVEGRPVAHGTVQPVLSGAVVDVLVCSLVVDGEVEWVVVDLDANGVTVRELPSVDATRRVAAVDLHGVAIADDRRLGGVDDALVRDVLATCGAAELVGVAQWCVDTAAEHARERVQFGRPIGQFQGVKHKCADMLCRVELARAAAWDAARAVDDSTARSLAAAIAIALALDAAFENGKDCIQVLGGIGFTWEHDAHVYLKRAMAMRSLLGPASSWRAIACEQALGGIRRGQSVDLGPEADAVRAEVRTFLEEIKSLDPAEQRARIADEGYVMPTWPRPWGRDAKAVEQVVIDEEFRAAGIRRPSIMIGSWALPPVIMYGTREQQERWIPPTLRGEITWCQLFSEPGAGSDLASLTTRAERVEGGWLINGQKVWTSMAHRADWGILLARTDPDAPKHEGITCFMVDMKHTSAIDVRPLRELTGESMFNEVFFDDAFVPDDCVVGRVNDGWRAARTTLANERVFMGSGMSFGHGLEDVLRMVGERGIGDDPLVRDQVGGLIATAHALSCLGFRLTLAALAGADPSGSEASVRKLLGVEHDQRVQEVGLTLCGADGAINDGDGARWSRGFLFNRNLTIAGGTSEIQRNIIGERVLGLPRDP